jgi:hypothetical protein
MRSRITLLYTFGLLLLGLMAMASSCSVFRTFFPSAGPPPRPFNHEAHIVRGISCQDCHETAEKEARAGMPTKAFCMTCHEDLDQDPAKPLEKKVAWFLDEAGAPLWSAFTKQSSEVRFSHKDHGTKKMECTACHAGIDKDTGLVPGMLQRMDSCTSCHAAQAPAKNDCATCHTRINRETPPPSHSQLWGKLHGACSRQGRSAATANDCSMCHEQDSCTTCHQTRPPGDHNHFWRLKSHGIAAAIDRSRCQTCHASDSCDRCHQSTAPRSHTAGWDRPRNSHCTGCHLPLGRSGSCSVCHKATPGHDAAPPKPAWHNPAMNCRSCHALSLRHPDNGDNCNACHR